MNKFKVLVSGCSGHMGQIVCDLIQKSDDMEVVAGFDTIAREFSTFPIFDNISDLEEIYHCSNSDDDDNNIPDIIIDFSSPDCTMQLLKYAQRNCIDMVIATTGFTDEQLSEIEECSKHIMIFLSANMSYEVNLMAKILKEISPKLEKDNDIEISEIHHNRKKDAPSGTAKMLAQAINSSLENKKELVFNHSGKRKNDEIGVIALRGGNVVGTHTIYYFGQYETLEITHTALSRELFAEGALRAARFLNSQNDEGYICGFYNMDDLM